MACSDQHELQMINQITESLSCAEQRKLLYLCEVLETDNSELCTKEMLKCKVMDCATGHLLLRELMLQLRRYDILRKVCKTSRDEVERTQMHSPVLPRFRVLMANISEDMASEDLKSLKFLLSSTLPREKIEKAKSFLDVIIELEKLDKVSPESVDLVEKCLLNIHRADLAKKVTAYKVSAVTSEQHSPQQPKSRGPQTRPEQPFHSEYTTVPAYRGQSRRDQLDNYKFNTDPRGVCLIIDCVGNDGDMLERTFKALHFNVIHYKWLSVNETLSALRGIFGHRDRPEGDGFVCCIITRGRANNLLGTDTHSIGLNLDSVRRLFTADACPALAGKPKLFFIQTYSVPDLQPYARIAHRNEDLETDGCIGIPEDADVFWSHCWTDERQLVQGQHSSIYLKALNNALHESQQRNIHVVDAHTEVNRTIFEHNKRNPEATYHIDLKHTLRKDLYL